MIEIIGMSESKEQRPERRSLPKNVRQVGESREKQKIYMEDYVVTYLGRLARPNQAYARGAILFGRRFETEEGPAIFINGAVEAQNLELDMDEVVFSDSIWEEILQKGREYFPEEQVMGWFLSRMGFSVEMNQKIINTHLKNFSGGSKVLYMMDALENEDAIYLCENQQMKRQKGYYIYYEKNNAMQEYMIASDGGRQKRVEENRQKSEIRRDKAIVNGYRRMSNYKRESKKQDIRIRGIRAACLVMICLMGVYIFGQLQKRWSGSGMENYVIETFQAVRSVFGPDGQSKVQEETWSGDENSTDENNAEGMTRQDGTPAGTGQDGGTEEAGLQNGQDGKKEDAANSTASGAETQVVVGPPEAEDLDKITAETQETAAQPFYYTVKKGDTLAGISRKMYASDQYTRQIAQANDLADVNEIYEGQRLLIPSIKQ